MAGSGPDTLQLWVLQRGFYYSSFSPLSLFSFIPGKVFWAQPKGQSVSFHSLGLSLSVSPSPTHLGQAEFGVRHPAKPRCHSLAGSPGPPDSSTFRRPGLPGNREPPAGESHLLWKGARFRLTDPEAAVSGMIPSVLSRVLPAVVTLPSGWAQRGLS